MFFETKLSSFSFTSRNHSEKHRVGFLKDKHKIQPASAIGIISPPAEKPLWDLLTLTARFGKFSREPRPGQGQQCPVPDVVYEDDQEQRRPSPHTLTVDIPIRSLKIRKVVRNTSLYTREPKALSLNLYLNLRRPIIHAFGQGLRIFLRYLSLFIYLYSLILYPPWILLQVCKKYAVL